MKYALVHASLSMVRGAMTDTDEMPVAGEPVRGSMMCEYARPPARKNFSSLPDVESDASFRNCVDTTPDGARGLRITTDHPRGLSGGAPRP